jgi:hypothetical protein
VCACRRRSNDWWCRTCLHSRRQEENLDAEDQLAYNDDDHSGNDYDDHSGNDYDDHHHDGADNHHDDPDHNNDNRAVGNWPASFGC